MTIRRGKIPLVWQVRQGECGPACLTMALRLHGKWLTLEEVREVVGIGPRGANLDALAKAAHHFGLTADPVLTDADAVAPLAAGTILHLRSGHFVVLERCTRAAVWVADPAIGRRRLPLDKFRRAFDGHALLVEPSPSFVRTRNRPKPLRAFAAEVFGLRNVWIKILTLSAVNQVLSLTPPFLTAVIVDRIVPTGDYRLLSILLASMLVFLGCQSWSTFVRSKALLQLRVRLDAVLTRRFVSHLLELPLKFFQRHSTGDLTMRLYSNATVRGVITFGILSGLLDGATVTIYLVIIFIASTKLALLVAIIAAVQIVLLATARRARNQMSLENLEALAQAQTFDVEMLMGIETVKAVGAEGAVLSKWLARFSSVQDVTLRQGNFDAKLDAMQTWLRIASPLAILAFGATEVISHRMSLGQMLAANGIAAGFLNPLNALAGLGANLQMIERTLDRLDDVISTPVERAKVGTRAQPIAGDIALDRVTFRYGPLEPAVVLDISLQIRPGEFVAIVGASGCGKSTLARLMLGLHEPSVGRVLHDGTDMCQLDVQTVRRHIGVVMQQPCLFSETVRANIALKDPEMPLEQVIQAARKAQIHDHIMTLPYQYETVLKTTSASLSAGQQQRLALARAFAGAPTVLLLDEATSQLDSWTAMKIQDELNSMTCTRIVIAHRLHALINVDRIYVMDSGRIVEEGTHDQLLKSRGPYSAFVDGEGASVNTG